MAKQGDVRIHFSDHIPPELKQKLLSFGLLASSPDSILASLRPPEYIRQRLGPLHGLCTYQYLDNIRYGEYEEIVWDHGREATTTDEWFDQLRESTSEWSYAPRDPDRVRHETLRRDGMLSHQWGCMGEELQALDRATRVPPDSPNTEKLYQAVRSIPEWIIGEIYKLAPSIQVTIQPTGSYPCGAKVGNIDEFDFLLICEELTATHEHSKVLSIRDRLVIQLKEVVQEKLFPRYIKKLWLQSEKSAMSYTEEPVVTSVFTHGPAQCIELGWRCNEGHVHDVSIDVTIALKWPGRLKDSMTELKEKPIFHRVFDTMKEEEPEVRLLETLKVTLSHIENRMYQELASVSENILPAYRILKVLNKHILPSFALQLPHSTRRFSLSTIISSHKLKQALYFNVMAHPTPKEWGVDQLHLQICEIFSSVTLGKSVALLDLNKSYNIHVKFKDDFEKHILIRAASIHTENIKMLIKYLLKKYRQISNNKKDSDASIGLTLSKRVKYMVLMKGFLHPCDGEKEKIFLMGDPKGSVLFYDLKESKMLFRSHPTLIWCQSLLKQNYDRNQGVDLSKYTLSETDLGWSLYKANLISVDEFNCRDTFEMKCSKLQVICDELFRLGAMKDEHNISRVLISLRGGIDQQLVVEAFLELNKIQHFPAEMYEEITGMQETLPLLVSRERAVIYKICQEAIMGDASSGISMLFGCDAIRHSDILQRENLCKILRCLEWSCVLIERFAEDTLSTAYLQPHLLVLHVIHHMIMSEPNYFSMLITQDYCYAEDIVRLIKEAEVELRIDCFSPRSNTELLMFDQLLQLATSWKVVRVSRGLESLYRSVATAGLGVSTYRAPRTTAGTLLCLKDAAQEDNLSYQLRIQVCMILIRHFEIVKAAITSFHPDLESHLENANLQELIIANIMNPAQLPTYLVLVALAYYAKRQIKIFKKEKRSGDLILQDSVPKTIYSVRQPIQLLYYDKPTITKSAEFELN